MHPHFLCFSYHTDTPPSCISKNCVFSGADLTVTYSGVASIAKQVTVMKRSKYGVRIEANNRSETWLNRNADGTMTITHIYLAGENNKPVEELQ